MAGCTRFSRYLGGARAGLPGDAVTRVSVEGASCLGFHFRCDRVDEAGAQVPLLPVQRDVEVPPGRDVDQLAGLDRTCGVLSREHGPAKAEAGGDREVGGGRDVVTWGVGSAP